MPSRLEQTRPTGHGRARGLVSSRVSGDRVRARTYAVAPELAGVIESYWTGRWDLRDQAPHTTELLGDPCVHLVFEASDGPHDGSRLVGVWTRLWTRTLQGAGMVRGVKLRAGAMRAFVRRPAFALRNRIIPLDSVLGPAVQSVESVARTHPDDEEAFAAIERWLLALRLVDEQIDLAVNLVARIVGDPELRTVEQLAESSGTSIRALQRLFREYVGATPKWVIRRHRLQEVALRIERGEAPSLAALAAELGYADHAHLARDFKAAVGKSPSAFAVSVHR